MSCNLCEQRQMYGLEGECFRCVMQRRIVELEAEVERLTKSESDRREKYIWKKWDGLLRRLSDNEVITRAIAITTEECESIVAKHKRVLSKALAHFAKKRKAQRQAITALMAVNERLRADGERLTYVIDQHGSGTDLDVMDRIADIAVAIWLVSEEADDIQKWYRAAIDAAREEKG